MDPAAAQPAAALLPSAANPQVDPSRPGTRTTSLAGAPQSASPADLRTQIANEAPESPASSTNVPRVIDRRPPRHRPTSPRVIDRRPPRDQPRTGLPDPGPRRRRPLGTPESQVPPGLRGNQHDPAGHSSEIPANGQLPPGPSRFPLAKVAERIHIMRASRDFETGWGGFPESWAELGARERIESSKTDCRSGWC